MQRELTKIKLDNLRKTPRCGAKTRRHTTCLSPRVRGNQRCRMHGGKGSGTPKRSQNALKHGGYTHEAIAQRREVRVLIRQWHALQNEV